MFQISANKSPISPLPEHKTIGRLGFAWYGRDYVRVGWPDPLPAQREALLRCWCGWGAVSDRCGDSSTPFTPSGVYYESVRRLPGPLLQAGEGAAAGPEFNLWRPQRHTSH